MLEELVHSVGVQVAAAVAIAALGQALILWRSRLADQISRRAFKESLAHQDACIDRLQLLIEQSKDADNAAHRRIFEAVESQAKEMARMQGTMHERERQESMRNSPRLET